MVLGEWRLLCHASSFRLRRSACPTRLSASGSFGGSPQSHTLQDNCLPSVTTTVMRTAFRANESRTPEDSSPMRISDVCLYLRYWRWIFRGGVHTQQRNRPFLRPTPTSQYKDRSPAIRTPAQRGSSSALPWTAL